MVRTLHFHCRGPRFSICLGKYILQAKRPKREIEKKKKKKTQNSTGYKLPKYRNRTSLKQLYRDIFTNHKIHLFKVHDYTLLVHLRRCATTAEV